MQFALGLRLELCLCTNVQREGEKYNYPATAVLTQGQGHADKPQPVSRSALTVRGAALNPSPNGNSPGEDPSLSLCTQHDFFCLSPPWKYLSRCRNALKASQFAVCWERWMKNSWSAVFLQSRQTIHLWQLQQCRNLCNGHFNCLLIYFFSLWVPLRCL